MQLSFKGVASIVIYGIVIFFLVFAVYCESKDIRCSEFNNGDCGPGRGVAYAEGTPKKGDSHETLIEKAKLTARYEMNSIMWRRCFIAAAVSAFLVLYSGTKRIPTGIQFGAAFLMIYIIFYLTITSFQKWIAQKAIKQMDLILTGLS